jgi:hypothetical protein
MEHDTPSHDYTPTYQISLIYRKRQKSYDSDTITLQKYQLFDLEVKGQRQNVVMLIKFKNWWVTVQTKKGISKIIQENRQKRELTLCSI